MFVTSNHSKLVSLLPAAFASTSVITSLPAGGGTIARGEPLSRHWPGPGCAAHWLFAAPGVPRFGPVAAYCAVPLQKLLGSSLPDALVKSGSSCSDAPDVEVVHVTAS